MQLHHPNTGAPGLDLREHSRQPAAATFSFLEYRRASGGIPPLRAKTHKNTRISPFFLTANARSFCSKADEIEQRRRPGAGPKPLR
jgi:hypothetical protein